MGFAFGGLFGADFGVCLSDFGNRYVIFAAAKLAVTVTRAAHSLLPNVASGLYYLSELVEEHTVFAKKLLTRLIIAVVVLQVILCLVDGFPLGISALSVVSHLVYSQNLRRFPIVKLTDPLFLLSCGMIMHTLLPAASDTAADSENSSRTGQPLRMVPPLLQPATSII